MIRSVANVEETNGDTVSFPPRITGKGRADGLSASMVGIDGWNRRYVNGCIYFEPKRRNITTLEAAYESRRYTSMVANDSVPFLLESFLFVRVYLEVRLAKK